MKTVITMLLVVCTAVPATLQAQGVWRCGPDGRIFTDAACPQGQPLELAAARPAEDLHSAQQRADREKALADRLQRDRQMREAQPGAGPAGIYGLRPVVKAPAKPKVKARHKHPQHRLEAPDTWTTVAPLIRRKKD